jgi:site-specific DNA recombinase
MTTGTIPFGWNRGPGKTLLPNPAEQQTILQMHRSRQAGRSYHAIAQDLNRAGVRTKLSGHWQSGNVAKVLNNRTTREWLQSLQHIEEAQAA